ncbi:unnamed protein product [Rotaria sp. Silwood1]|nr:unnamed protein product [Rotaria sp. Silwood1]
MENQTLKTIKAGSICTVENGNGKFGIVKVLVIDDKQIHVTIYKNKYDLRPSQIDLSTLSCGSLYDADEEIGVGHAPLFREGFNNWKPIVIDYEEVTSDNLDGYEIWKAKFHSY